MTHAGVAQGERPVRPEGAGESPAPRSTIPPEIRELAKAVAAAFAFDPASRERGYRDGLAGAKWSPPPGCDVLAYALGHYGGELDRARQRGMA